MLPLGRDQRWVFIGDSITDCQRREDPAGLGLGYVRDIQLWLLARSSAEAPHVLNRGVGGDRIIDLAARWQEDVIAADPHVVSVKIGINDVWRQIDKQAEGVELEQYVDIYGRILRDLIEACPQARLVLCEPSVISLPASAEGNAMVLPYAMAVREIAAQFKDHVECTVPFHGVCREAEDNRPDVVWWPDGVHPSPAGHMLLARTWLNEVGLL